MNQITTRTANGTVTISTLQPEISAKLANNISVARNGLFGSQLLASHAPKPDERLDLAGHANALRAYIAPGDRREIAQAIAKIFLALTPRGDDADGARARIATFVEVLSPLPVWAVSKAVSDFLTGRVGDGKWCPTAVELYKRGAGYVASTVEQITRIDEVLRAKVVEKITVQDRAATAKAIRQQWGLGEAAEKVLPQQGAA